MKINNITVAANGAHSHGVVGAVNAVGPAGTAKNIGSHLLEPATNHSHSIIASATYPTFPTAATPQKTNINGITFTNFNYKPATFTMAFIMYNENIP